jgi:hypothetical protein
LCLNGLEKCRNFGADEAAADLNVRLERMVVGNKAEACGDEALVTAG